MIMRTRTRLARFAFLLSAVAGLAGLLLTACGRPPARNAKTEPAPGEKTGKRKILYYRAPMNPAVTSDKPAKDEMGMDFVPVYEGEAEAGVGASGGVQGRAAVTLSPERRQLLGVQTAPVRRTSLQRTIRTVGTVTTDERLLHHIHTKFDGYVEHLYVNFTGQLVRRGEPLLSIYSPELVATQQEYLLAYRAQARLAGSPVASASRGASDLLDAARQRLLFWDIRPEDIARIEKTGQVLKTLELYSEVSGYVVQKTAFHGMRVTPADTLFDIADLSHLWVLADVYESDLPSVRVGMSAEISVPFLPGRTWRGPVTYIAPTVEEKTRTIKVRVEVANAGELLKPDMFADVLLKTELGLGLVAPESAVLAAGDRKIAFVDRGDGSLEPREVQIGPKVADGVQVLSGLAEGERVVTSANFLIDSESSLKAALSAMTGKPPTPPANGAHKH
jgi:Cu(I)/Ag(I) efflux system membrane fusion protein